MTSRISRAWMDKSPRARAWIFLFVGAAAVLAPVLRPEPAFAHSPHDNIRDVALSPNFAQDETMYAISRLYLLKSTDRGATWKKLVKGLDNKIGLSSVEVSSQNPSVLYAASPLDGVYKSIDAGLSWSKANTGLDGAIDMLAVSPHSDAIVFAANADRLFVTNTGATTWQAVGGLAGVRVTSIGFAPDRADVIFVGDASGVLHVSEDGGGTWTSTEIESANAGAVSAIAASPAYARDATLFVGTDGDGVFKSTDGGSSYTIVDDGLADHRVTSLLVSPAYPSDSSLWASTWDEGVFSSHDGGTKWTDTSDGLTKTGQAEEVGVANFAQLVASFAAEPNQASTTMFVTGFDGLFRSTTGGDAWQEMQTQSSSNITAIAVSPNHANDKTIAVATYLNGAFRSTDAGATWEEINDGLASRNLWLHHPDHVQRLMDIAFSPTFANDNTLFSGTRGYVFRSETRGTEWTPIVPEGVLVEGEFPPDYFISAFSPSYDRDGTVVLATEGGKVFRSEDGGRSFAKVATTDHGFIALAISPEYATDGTLFGATADGVFVSADRGETWTQTAEVPRRPVGIAISPGFGSDRSVFVATWNGLVVTRDAGTSWTPVTKTGYGNQAYIEAVAVSPNFVDDQTLLVSVRGRGLFKSTDGSATFRPVGTQLIDDNILFANFYHYTSAPIVFSPTYATDKTVYAFAEDKAFTSTDAAETWSEIPVPRMTHETTEASAPGELLATPRFADASAGGTPSTASSDVFTIRRVLAAAGLGLLVLIASFAIPFGGRSTRWKTVLRLSCAVVVCAGAFATLVIVR